MQLKQKNKKHKTKGKHEVTKHNISKSKLSDKRLLFKESFARMQGVKLVGYVGTTTEFQLSELSEAIDRNNMYLVHPTINILDYIQIVDYLIILECDEAILQLITHQGHSNIYYFGDKDKSKVGKHASSIKHLLQSLKTSIPKPHPYLKERGFCITEQMHYDEATETLVFSGLCRGPWNANQLCHVPNCGDFEILKISSFNKSEDMEAEVDLSIRNENGDTIVDYNNDAKEVEMEECHNDIIDNSEEKEFVDGLTEVERQEEYDEFIQNKYKDHLQFPDEVDACMNDCAIELYKDYRGLESFKTSPWDPYENLPNEYSQLFEFKHFKGIKNKYIADAKVAPVRDRFVSVYLKFPSRLLSQVSTTMVLWNLMPMETRSTVVNMTIIPTLDYISTITNENVSSLVKSGDELIIQYGFRRYKVNCLFSQESHNSSNNVHKLEPYLTSTCIASAVLPVTFLCGPILFFKQSHHLELIASGSLLNADFKRVIAKRIILTGDPFKVKATHKGVVCRFMFFNAEDVNYFKCIKLFTKLGLRGRIKESLGTHGYMKCIFNQPLLHHDTVCMALYKREFPQLGYTLYSE